ncbi:MAG: hypothetical protein PHV30_07405 [Candidatus Margulisbacteria bacterium]|nr:hypothetical protein [Candidatus Margulisiibacteriota bacterium]
MHASRKIDYYKNSDGSIPVFDFINKQKKNIIKNFFYLLRLLQTDRWLSPKYFKKVDKKNDIWELQLKDNKNIFNSDIYTLYFFFKSKNSVVITDADKKRAVGFDKIDIIDSELIETAIQKKRIYLKKVKE